MSCSDCFESILDQLDSGDLLLFDRNCFSMLHPLGISICAMAKLSSRFDHVGIVFKLHDRSLKRVISQLQQQNQCQSDVSNISVEMINLGQNDQRQTHDRHHYYPGGNYQSHQGSMIVKAISHNVNDNFDKIKSNLIRGRKGEVSDKFPSVSNFSSRNLYVLEANLGGVTLRPLESRLKRSSSNAIAVRLLQNVKRDESFHDSFTRITEKLLTFHYKSGLGDLLNLMLESPNKADQRHVAQQLLQIRAQLESIRSIVSYKSNRSNIHYHQLDQSSLLNPCPDFSSLSKTDNKFENRGESKSSKTVDGYEELLLDTMGKNSLMRENHPEIEIKFPLINSSLDNTSLSSTAAPYSTNTSAETDVSYKKEKPVSSSWLTDSKYNLIAAYERDLVNRYNNLIKSVFDRNISNKKDALGGSENCSFSFGKSSRHHPSVVDDLLLDPKADLDPKNGIVCSEIVALCLQATGVLPKYTSPDMYLPRDFDSPRSKYRVIFNNPNYSFSDIIFLTGPEAKCIKQKNHLDESVLPSIKENENKNSVYNNKGFNFLEVNSETDRSHIMFTPVAELRTRHTETKKKSLTYGILSMGELFMIATLLSAPLYARQASSQLMAHLQRGNFLTLAIGEALQIVTGSFLHTEIAKLMINYRLGDLCSTSLLEDLNDNNDKNSLNSSSPQVSQSLPHLQVGLDHPFYDSIIRIGCIAYVIAFLTAPISILNLRFHFCSYTKWYRVPFRCLFNSSVFSLVAFSSYLGAYSWPLVYESIVPFLLPLAPSLYHQKKDNCKPKVVSSLDKKTDQRNLIEMCSIIKNPNTSETVEENSIKNIIIPSEYKDKEDNNKKNDLLWLFKSYQLFSEGRNKKTTNNINNNNFLPIEIDEIKAKTFEDEENAERNLGIKIAITLCAFHGIIAYPLETIRVRYALFPKLNLFPSLFHRRSFSSFSFKTYNNNIPAGLNGNLFAGWRYNVFRGLIIFAVTGFTFSN